MSEVVRLGSDEVAPDLYAQLTRAAFGDGPGVPASVLARAQHGPPGLRWLAAVVLGARGHYARAAALLEPLVRDPEYGSLAASALGSHRRQLGGHAQARHWDAKALRLAAATGGLSAASDIAAGGSLETTGSAGPGAPIYSTDPDGLDAPGALADALLGLTADALALGRQSESRRLLARVRSTSWRTEVRLGWVRAEVELAAGNADAAREPAEAASKLAHEQGAVRHIVKSDLVLAAALLAGGQYVDRAGELVHRASRLAYEYELDSLCWPAELIVAGFDPNRAETHQRRARAVLRRVLQRADAAGRAVALGSAWVPME